MKKIIHYFYDNIDIWKKNNKSTFRMCYFSWKKYCPDYEIMLWDPKMEEIKKLKKESKFFAYCYDNNIWGSVSDYVRYYALYKYGGIYLDTDVQLVQSPDKYMDLPFFCSIEGDILDGENIPEPAVMGGQKGHILFKEILDFYNSDDIFKLNYPIANVVLGKYLKDKINFRKIEYSNEYYTKSAEKYYDKNVNVTRIDDFDLYKNQLIFKDEKYGITIFPSEYFCPTWEVHGQNAVTENTVAIHWNQSSWWNDFQKVRILFAQRYKNKFRKFLFMYSERIAKFFTFFIPNKNLRKRARNNIKNFCER